MFLLHQPAPNPYECQKPKGSCPTCIFLERCHEIVKKKYPCLSKEELKKTEAEAQKVSLGSLTHEEKYRPDE